MFQLLASSLFASSPLTKWVKDHFIFLLLALLALSALGYHAYNVISTKKEIAALKTQLASADVALGEKQKTIDDQVVTIKSLNQQLVLAKASNVITIEVDAKTHAAVADSTEKHTQRQKNLGKRIATVKKDPTKTEAQKAEAVSYALAADLMVGWCGEHITSSPTACDDYPEYSTTVSEEPIELTPSTTLTQPPPPESPTTVDPAQPQGE